MNNDEFIDVTTNAQQQPQQQQPQPQAFGGAPVLPKVEQYVDQKVKANPGLGATLLSIAGIADIVVASFQILLALLLLFASSLISSMMASIMGAGVIDGLDGYNSTSLLVLNMIQNFGTTIFIILAILLLILGGLNIWFAIRALRDRFIPGKGGFLFTAGVVQTVLSVIFLIMSGFGFWNFIFTAFSVCYLLGAYLKRQADAKL